MRTTELRTGGSVSWYTTHPRVLGSIELLMWTRRDFVKTALCGVAAASSLPAAEDGFEPLFNGENLNGWEGDDLLWFVENGELVGKSPGIGYNDFLATTEEFGDFTLRFQVKLIDNVGNSGLQFRSQRVKGSMEMIGYQADIGPTWWGDLYDESRRRVTLVEADHDLIDRIVKKGDWNDYEILAEGKHVRLSINGTVTADYTEEDPDIAETGRIAVQIHSGPPLEVRFRNLHIKRA
jgi:hypothetical protein